MPVIPGCLETRSVKDAGLNHSGHLLSCSAKNRSVPSITDHNRVTPQPMMQAEAQGMSTLTLWFWLTSLVNENAR